MQVLLVEDDLSLGEGLKIALESEGYQVHWCQDGQAAAEHVFETPTDLAVLDLGLPKLDGIDVLKRWRQDQFSFPVLVLTARGTAQDKITGLDTGADDYLSKPFDREEMLARVRALLRRSSSVSAGNIDYGALSISIKDKLVTYNQKPINLSRREYHLLEKLASHPGHIYSRNDLEEILYDLDTDVASNTIEVHIHNIRKKTSPELIKTVRGLGYKLES